MDVCIQITLKFFLRTFRNQWRYLTCSLDPKLQADTNYIRVERIGVAYRPTSPTSAESKKSLIFRICGFVGIFLCLRQKSEFFHQNGPKFFLRIFRHQWRYLTCFLDPKLQVDINYIRVGWIGVAYRPTSPASAESKKSLIFRICGFVGIFSCLRQKSELFSSKWL